MKKKTERQGTDPKKLFDAPEEEDVFEGEAWSQFEKFYAYAKYREVNPNTYELVIDSFLQPNPSTFLNKWGRTQFRILVLVGQETQWLTGGKRLFTALKEFLTGADFKNPTFVQHQVKIIRFGKSVDSSYKVDWT